MTVSIPNPAPDVYPSERVSRLRERIIHAPREACVERARYLTRSMAANWDEPPLTRMSRAFAEILDNISVIIREDELVVGCRTSRLKGAPFFPENKSRWIEGDVDRFEERVIQKVRIGDAAARELEQEILPFWRGRTAEERFEQLLPASRDAQVLDFFATREPAATFRGVPGSGRLRPGPDVGVPGVSLAGAWTDTGWPATMEGAVRSGHAAARLALPA